MPPTDSPGLPHPVSTTEVLLVAVVERLDALLASQRQLGESAAAQPTRAPRKRSATPPTERA